MNTKLKNKFKPLKAAFGVRSVSGQMAVPKPTSYAMVNTGWMEFVFGTAEVGGNFLVAHHGDCGFTLSENPPIDYLIRSPMNEDWVSSMDAFPEDLVRGMVVSSNMCTNGFVIAVGSDRAGAVVLLTMPNELIRLVFRDPRSMAGLPRAGHGTSLIRQGQEFRPAAGRTKTGVGLTLVK